MRNKFVEIALIISIALLLSIVILLISISHRLSYNEAANQASQKENQANQKEIIGSVNTLKDYFKESSVIQVSESGLKITQY